ncbi:MAG TPA: TonB-dependent receptor, partial [Gemmatimonadaceae bacterium]|nr:TonB-dependent receptor [Gemmatimonadaceae bacterium]
GMPLTAPDGQTPLDYVDLESVGEVEVLRGTSSALYGNASGGVIDIKSAPPPPAAFEPSVRVWGGSDALAHVTALAGGTAGPLSYEMNVGHTSANNYRAFSLQRTTDGYAHVGLEAAGTTFTLSALGLDTPTAENPGAITRAQFDSNPAEADPLSVAKRARKQVKQLQVGLAADHVDVDGLEWSATTYVGSRRLYNPLTYAVVGVGWHMAGAGVRVTKPIALGPASLRLTVGADEQYQNDDRQNWANCDGLTAATATCPNISVEEGTLSLDQREIVSSIGPYARAELTRGRLSASAGVRSDAVAFRVEDSLTLNGGNSGSRTLHAVSPMAGLSYRLTRIMSAYVDVSTGFETPTITELGTKPDGSSGLNPDLDPQISTTYEVGGRGFGVAGFMYDLALFHSDVRDELIPYAVPGGAGRTYYRNAGATRHDGVELGLERVTGPFTTDLTYAWSRFRFERFVVGSASYGGNAIPGIPEHEVQGSETWRSAHGFVVAEVVGKSAVWVNDANQARAPGFALLNLRAGGLESFGRGRLTPIVGIQNVFNTKYVGSVAINATGATLAATKFYEPGAGRTFSIGFQAGGEQSK